jgi:hypothetical protein
MGLMIPGERGSLHRADRTRERGSEVGINDPAKLTLWLDGRRIDLVTGGSGGLTAELARGLHTLTIALEPTSRRQDLRFTLEDVPGSAARAQVLLGR